MRVSEGDGRSNSFPYRTRLFAGTHGDIAYFDEGRGEALIWVHGLGGDFTHFEHVAPLFADRFRTIGLDLPGCGRSCKPITRYSARAYGRTVLELMDALDISQATLLGHSAGGLVCAQAALACPDRVTRLVLVDSAGIAHYSRPLQFAARAILQPWLLVMTLERLAMPMLDRVFHQQNEYTAQFIANVLDRPRQPALNELAKVFHDIGPDLMQGTVYEHAERLTMPTLIVWGDRDRLVPLRTVAKAAARLPDGQLEIIENCGHMPMIEAPGTFARIVASFIAGSRRFSARA